jgi:DNA polymerase-3 subunit delta'
MSSILNNEKSTVYPWLQKTWYDLLLQHQNNHLPHAMLLSGSEGLGKRDLAKKLSQYLLCLSPKVSSSAFSSNIKKACQECRSCKLFMSHSHPDYLLCEPEEKGKQIKIDSIRQINDFVQKTPQISKTKIVQIYPIETMNMNAANALLKTLEEPAGETYLLLVAQHLGSVLPTIKSRVQKISIPLANTETHIAWLMSESWGSELSLSIEEKKQRVALSIQRCGRAPLKTLSWLCSDALDNDILRFNLMHEWLSQSTNLSKTSKAFQK